MHPLCADQGIAVIPWSPLARGRLARPAGQVTDRSASDSFGSRLYRSDRGDAQVIDAVGRIAEKRGITRAEVALGWLLGKDTVTAPIVGITKAKHLADALAALDITLTDDEISQLETPYVPHEVAGFA